MKKSEISLFFDELIESGWVADMPVNWIYHFFGVKRGDLFFAGEELKEYGYSVIDIAEDKEEPGIHRMILEKVESLPMADMMIKIEALEELADDFKIFFDYFEVEILENDK